MSRKNSTNTKKGKTQLPVHRSKSSTSSLVHSSSIMNMTQYETINYTQTWSKCR